MTWTTGWLKCGAILMAVWARDPVHPIFDYVRYLPTAHLQVVSIEPQTVAGLRVYASILTRRFATEPTTAAKRPDRAAPAEG